VTTDTRNLNALLGSRICHDLISPLGAIDNGLELLSMAGIGQTPELSLIAQSVESANARIRFFRVAFGAAPDGQDLSHQDILAVLGPMWRDSRLTVEWRLHAPCPRSEVKLSFLLLQCFDSAMPWGGSLTVERREGRWHLDASADKLKVDPTLWAGLGETGPQASVTAAEVHFPLAAAAASALGRSVRVDLGDQTLSVIA
jgi:histidine phosphotransferase ChpT